MGILNSETDRRLKAEADRDCYREEVAALRARVEELEKSYKTLIEDVQGACGCTDGDDIRRHLSEYLEGVVY